MVDVFLDKRLDDYFCAHEWSDIATEDAARDAVINDYLNERIAGLHGLDTNRLEADYDQGVLTLRIPVAEAAKPRRVEITKSAAGRPAIVEGQATHES